MDLNQKIAERRAELQRQETAEAARKRQEVLEQMQQEEEQKNAIKESAEKEAAHKIQEIDARLHGTTEKVSVEAPPVLDQRVKQEAEKKVDAHIRELASKRFTKKERWTGGVLFLGSILGFFVTWWFGLGMLIWTGYYAIKVSNRHETDIRAELAQFKEGNNE